MDKEKILHTWSEEIEKDFQHMHPKVLEKRRQIKEGANQLTIWLGGPGRDHDLFPLRELLKEFLAKEGFEVIFSEDYQGGADLASKEIEEIEALDMVIILSITAGASAEAIEFAHLPDVRPKLWVYVPIEYKNGYVCRSLFGRHRFIAEDSFFSLGSFRNCDPELAVKLMRRAIVQRNSLYRKEKLRNCEDCFQ